MNTIIKRAMAAAALLTVVAVSGCASIEGASWGSAAQSMQKLPGDSLGYLVEPDTSERVA
jgi:hypothetical protein